MSGPENLNGTGLWRRHLSAVDTFTPGLPDDERELRARLMLSRDLALARLRDASPDAAELLQAIYSIASRWVFTSATADDLRNVRKSLVRIMLAASALDWRIDHEAI